MGPQGNDACAGIARLRPRGWLAVWLAAHQSGGALRPRMRQKCASAVRIPALLASLRRIPEIHSGDTNSLLKLGKWLTLSEGDGGI